MNFVPIKSVTVPGGLSHLARPPIMHRGPAGPSSRVGRLWLVLNKRYDQKMVIVHGKSSENDA